MNETVSPARRLPPTLLAVIMAAFLLGLVLVYLGLNTFLSSPTATDGLYMVSIGMVTLALSTYMLYQTRKRMIRLISMEMQPLSSTVQCQKCGLKNIREFKRGDYVFKETDEKCPKDNEKMVIQAIYREVKEKEKAKELGY